MPVDDLPATAPRGRSSATDGSPASSPSGTVPRRRLVRAPSSLVRAARGLPAAFRRRSRGPGATAPLREAPRQIERARRRDEPAEVALLRGRGDLADATRLTAMLRCTDAIDVSRRRRGWEAQLVVDAKDLDRDGLTGRVRERMPGVEVAWARFPDDGATLQALVDTARDELEGVAHDRA